jgi:hypothetical protein
MDLAYLDYNCFQQGFDGPRQVRTQMEAPVYLGEHQPMAEAGD